VTTRDEGPGAIRVRPGTIEINADRGPDERLTLVVVNTGDRPIQVGSHLHLPDANPALDLDRAQAHGFRLDIASGTSVRFEPGVSREVALVALRGRRRVPGLQVDGRGAGELDG
jgi:urease subunit beta